MSPEAQRSAIVEACGWQPQPEVQDPKSLWDDVAIAKLMNNPSRLPDYLGDLNAMHEAENYAGEHLMDADQWEEYGRQLERMHPQACVRATDGSIDYYDLATLLTDLTAAQRAEAFLRTLGLWKE